MGNFRQRVMINVHTSRNIALVVSDGQKYMHICINKGALYPATYSSADAPCFWPLPLLNLSTCDNWS